MTPIHYLYLLGVIVILTIMILRKDTPAVCIGFLFLIGLVGMKSFTGGLMTVFNAILYSTKEFIEIISTIALITAFSKCLKDLGSDYLIMLPVSKIMKRPSTTWWILGVSMMVSSLFLWPSASVALVGTMILPFAIKVGVNPLMAAVAMNLFGHGIALSYDFIIKGTPSVCAASAGISTDTILSQGKPLFLVMGIVTVTCSFFLNRHDLSNTNLSHTDLSHLKKPPITKSGVLIAILTPIAFIFDLVIMIALGLKGSDATSLVSGTAVMLMCIGTVLKFQKESLEQITEYVIEGFLFSFKIFAPVIIIGAFFFLGGSGIKTILGDSFGNGILNDWAIWLANHTPLNKYMIGFIQMVVGALTGLDGSGLSGLPLTGALANTFGNAVGASIPVLASLGQISAIFVGGGTIVPWGLISVAAICDVNPTDLAKKNMLPVFIGFIATFVVACFLL